MESDPKYISGLDHHQKLTCSFNLYAQS